ncbi:MAG TPA: protoporphyrinogen oxidase, partial [Microthrixaceae bacterium]|nr:protoporphyrinogen oxidase [Microthrixaceae bacterium]
VPDAIELCRELGLEGEMTQPATGRAKVYVNGALKFLPTDTVLGVPVEFGPLEDSGLLSAAGVLRARSEVDQDWSAPDRDVSIGAFLEERYGRELVDNVVAPLIGGINAGNVDKLSLASVTPQLASAAAEGGSLTLALRRRAAALSAQAPDAPIFRALVQGTGRLVEALESALIERGVTIRLNCSVSRIEAGSVTLNDGERLHCDALLICTPAPAAAELLAGINNAVANELRAITYSSVALVTMVYDRASLSDIDLDASGFLIPRSAQLLMTAASIGSTKWEHWNDGSHIVMRVSAGHSTDNRGETLSDEELLSGLVEDLRQTIGIEAAPVASRISRWRRGFAQYEVGHAERVDRIQTELNSAAPNIALAGASYRGLGIPACISQGRSAARALLS